MSSSATRSPDPSRRLPDGEDGWRDFLSGFSDIVLVANSDAVDMAALTARFGETALFVFFNKVYKILDTPFARRSLLVARSSGAGANIVYRREVENVVQLLAEPGFSGILNLSVASHERFSPRDAFGQRPVGFLDLAPHFRGFYSADHVPSSGFALAVWLAEQELSAKVFLAGFTGQRGSWKVFRVHDWTFEQIVQTALIRSGRLGTVPAAGQHGAAERIAARFPGMATDDVLAAASDVLAHRLDDADRAIDGLISVTRLQRTLDGFLRRLKPRTRKQKIAQRGQG